MENENLEEIKRKKFWAGAILYNPESDSVLLQKRDDEAPVNPDKWAFFGGSSEEGETPQDCVVRELKEEIGVEIAPAGLKVLREYFYKELMSWRYVYSMEFNLEKSQMVLGEGEDFDWVPLDKVFDYDLTDNTRSDLEFFTSKV